MSTNQNTRQGQPIFLCDAMLGTLARWLRFFGLDTIYPQPGMEDRELAAIAEEGGRWLLTRDGELAARGPRTLLVRSADLDGQLVEVLGRLDLRPEVNLDRARCSECNGSLTEVTRAEVESTIPPHVAATAPRFRRCEGCGRVYWPGSHGDRILSRMAAVLARLGDGTGNP